MLSEGQATVVLLVAAFIGLVMLFAQVKLFEINTTLKQILAELKGEGESAAEPSPTSVERPAPAEEDLGGALPKLRRFLEND